ncbi:hypothetical protein LTS10_006405 [Elasticomyces elasticus]|nr:hypothetical protein LTS10_006405 [Elasticomyces elasticus]
MQYTRKLDAQLREIRTLTLDGTDADGLIACSLNTVCLDEAQYTALSYVWGDASKTTPILVDGQTFQATVNLELALRNLSEDYAGKPVWADAICINQDDVQEKNQQVSLMDELYRRAVGVVVWLGESDPAVDMLVEVLAEHAECSIVDGDLTAMPKSEAMLMAIAQRPWWKRVWVIQEALMARHDPVLRCGRHAFGWSSFFAFLLAYSKKGEQLGLTQNEETPEVTQLRQILAVDDTFMPPYVMIPSK